MAILFFEEDIKFSLKEKNKTKRWLRDIAKLQGFKIGELNYIFFSDFGTVFGCCRSCYSCAFIPILRRSYIKLILTESRSCNL